MDRRTVLKSAVWSIPAIAVATAVPATAASPITDITALLRYNTWRNTAKWDNAGHRTSIITAIQVEVNYWNGPKPSEPVDDLIAVITYDAAFEVTGDPVISGHSDGGWVFDTRTKHSDGSVSYQFHYNGTILPSRNTGELEFIVAIEVWANKPIAVTYAKASNTEIATP